MHTNSYGPLAYPPSAHVPQGTTPPQIHASLPDHFFPSDSQPPPDNPPPSGHSSHMYSVLNAPPDHLDYTDFISPHRPHPLRPYIPSEHQQVPTSSPLRQDMPPSQAQVDTGINPGRVLTRRQRARLPQNRSELSEQSPVSMNNRTRQRPVFFITPSPSPPPHVEQSEIYTSLSENPSSNTASSAVSAPFPPSAGSAVSPYGVYSTDSGSASTSNSNPRSTSPALSVASSLTSVSSASAPLSQQTLTPFPLPSVQSPINPRQKQRKQRLFNVDRKAICEFHKRNPHARQEDIAVRYRVERSTISKILKHKTKWLNVPEHESMRVAKHRPSKFPEIEERLEEWLLETKRNNTVLSDALIRQKAKEVAQKLDIPDEKFKASSGWVENFKHRHGIRGGIWHSDGKYSRAPRAAVGGNPGEIATGMDSLNQTYDRQNAVNGVLPDYNGNLNADIAPPRPLSTWPAEPSPPVLPPVHRMTPMNLRTMHPLLPHDMVQHHHPESIVQYNHPAMSSHVIHDLPDGSQNVSMPMWMHPPTPQLRLRPDELPTAAEAEDACTIVMKYMKLVHPTLFSTQELEMLGLIKHALFQIGSGSSVDQRPV